MSYAPDTIENSSSFLLLFTKQSETVFRGKDKPYFPFNLGTLYISNISHPAVFTALPVVAKDKILISTENDLCAAGFYDYLDQGAIVAAEWSENFADLLALEQPIHVNIERVDENTRKITIEGVEV